MTSQPQTELKSATNGQLYDEWNAGCFARARGERITAAQEARLAAIYAEALSRPAEAA